MSGWLAAWWPAPAAIDRGERLRSCLGAMLGVVVTGLAGLWLLGPTPDAIWLMAPMGASAVLLFAVPSSPLAQPWSIVGGNLLAALVGVSCARHIALPVAAAGAALFLSVAGMLALRCLHPPSGAVALLAVVGGPAVQAAGYRYVLVPVALNTAVILLTALAYNRAVGRRYPQRVQPAPAQTHHTADPDPLQRMGYTPADLRGALSAGNRLLDVSVEDLEQLFRRTEMRAYARHHGQTRCRQLMSTDVLTVAYGTELDEAWQLMRSHDVRALPVIDRSRRVIGIVTRSDFLRHADLRDYRSLAQRLRDFLRRTPHSHSSKHEVVGQIMSSPVTTAWDEMPIAELVPLMSDLGRHHIPVINAERRLVGMVTQSDLVAALYETNLGRMGSSPALEAATEPQSQR